MWFYKIEHDKKIKMVKIIWNTKMTYIKNILGFGGLLACLLNQVWIASFCLLSLAILLGVYLYRYGDLVRALRVHEKNNEMNYKGSRYSFRNPLVVLVPVSVLS